MTLHSSSVKTLTIQALSKALGLILVILISVVGMMATERAAPAQALSGSEFNPENIISDDLFYDGSAMTAAQIQKFLDSEIGNCITDRCLNVAVLPVTSRPESYSSTTGSLICSSISGGNLTASELIYRVQVACGISAKVVLVTLQKEQGLVTSRAPSDWALRSAMGMGCPDTAPCNDAFSGLANQIFSGTRQLKIYKAANFGRQPGVQYVQYHPNASCGGSTLNVRNYATAALYNYTPYQPNAAALANLGGTGDSCSSYGNRNFWRFYNDWFGSTIEVPCTSNPGRDITRFWDDQGGVGGALGSLVSPGIVVGAGGYTVGYYSNGNVYCTPRIGAVAVVGIVLSKYLNGAGAAGPLGPPTVPESVLVAGGVTGVLQDFQQGTILSSVQTGTFAVLNGPMRNAWGERDGSGGSLGWPTGDQQTIPGGIQQQFQHGLVVLLTGRPAIVLNGDIGQYWSSGSNSTALGSPTGSVVSLTAGSVSGFYQVFERGMVLSSPTTGTHAVINGPIRNVWGALFGTGGTLGWPVADQQNHAGGFRQDFQGGTVFASGSGSGGVLAGNIATYWAAGANATLLGYPIDSSMQINAGGVSGTIQDFERGMVLSSGATGTFAVLHGPIRVEWGARDGTSGPLGWPIGDQQPMADGVRQPFQHGTLTIPFAAPVTGDIAGYWSTGINSILLGQSTAPPTVLNSGGVSGSLQIFAQGTVLSSAATGTFAVLNGPIRVAWGALDGSGGVLGWPTGDQQSVSGGVRQQFQHGAVFVPKSGVGVALFGSIGDYWATGANSSRLGVPTSAMLPINASGVSGFYQSFQRGMVLSSTATGTFTVLDGPIRNTWGALGGTGGTLGWPTAEEQSAVGGFSQQFQNGVIVAPTNGTSIVLAGAIGAYWSASSHSSLLGLPTTPQLALGAGGVTGVYQNFERGMVFASSETGTHAVINGPIRVAWGALDGTGGMLSWPTSDQEATGGVMYQKFYRGVLTIPSDGTPILLADAYFDFWSTGSNESLVGLPTHALVLLSASGVAGSYQEFSNAIVMSSETTGIHAVLNGPIRTAWGARDGSGGILGWPTGDQQAVPQGVRQQFQHGAVVVPTTGDPYVEMN